MTGWFGVWPVGTPRRSVLPDGNAGRDELPERSLRVDGRVGAVALAGARVLPATSCKSPAMSEPRVDAEALDVSGSRAVWRRR